MRGELLLLATRSMTEYMTRVAYQLRTFPDFPEGFRVDNFVGHVGTLTFADGEMEVEIDTSLRGKDVFLFATAARNPHGISVDQAKLELYHSVDAIRRAQADRITLIEPYCSSSRSDRTTRRNSVGFWVHYKTLAALGIDHIVTYQLHSDKSRSVVDPAICAIDDVPGIQLLQEYLTNSFIRTPEGLNEVVHEDWVFCSVDAGGEGLAKRFARAFGTKLIIAHKQRDYNRVNTIESVNILSDSTIAGKTIWIVDDMIDTAGSVQALVEELNKRDVGEVNICAVHPVFSPPATDRLGGLYREGLLERVVVTDTVHVSEQMEQEQPYLHVVSSARLSAEIIMRLHQLGSLSPFFEDFDAQRYLSSLKLFF